MRHALPVLLLLAAAGLAGCAAGQEDVSATAAPTATGYSQEVRSNFLDSCLDNAKNSAGGAATEEQLTQTCACILGKVEQEYSEPEFAEFEKRLLGGSASAEESGRLKGWSTGCARTASS